MRKMLLVTYRFYPMGGIGTRRWSKYIQELIKNDVECHVLTTVYPYRDENTYLDSNYIEKIYFHRIKGTVPPRILRPKLTYFERVIRKIVTIIRSRLLGYSDIADGWEDRWIDKAISVLDEYKIQNVIVTGPPSSLHGHSIRLKVARPQILLVQDYRDLWNCHRNYQNIRRPYNSIMNEYLTLIISDRILVVSKGSKDSLINQFEIDEGKILLSYNGYDTYNPAYLTRSDQRGLTLVYAGHLPPGRKDGLELLLRTMMEHGASNVIIHLYIGATSISFDDYFLDDFVSKICLCHDFVIERTLLSKLTEFDICLTINDKRDAHAFGSKIFDYLSINKPIFGITGPGELHEFLSDHDMPVSSYSKEDMQEAVTKLISGDYPKRFPEESVRTYDLRENIQMLIEILND